MTQSGLYTGPVTSAPIPDAYEPGIADYLAVFRRRMSTVIFATLGVVGVALVLTNLQQPVYRTSAQVLLQSVGTPTVESGGRAAFRDRDADRLLNTQLRVFSSEPVQKAVEQRLGPAFAPVTATAIPGTDIIQVSAESTEPREAAAVVNEYVKAYLDFRREQDVGGLLTATKTVQSKIDELQPQLAEIENQIASAPEEERAAAEIRLGAQQNSLRERLSEFRRRLDQLQVTTALTSGGAQLVKPASVPTDPVSPNRSRNLVLSASLGLIFALGLALVVDYFDDTVKDQRDLGRVVPGLSVLGVLPAARSRRKVDRYPVAVMTSPTSAEAEAYRSVRTALQFSRLENSIFSIQITSPAQAHGRASVTANLAAALGTGGQRVVAVCGNLRQPELHKHFDMENARGLTSVLLGHCSLDQALRRVKGQDQLSVLPAGPPAPNPSELLAGASLKETLATLRAKADIVVIDSSPVLPVTDATVLAALIDATVIVVTARRTRRGDLRQALDQLRFVDAPVLGVVLLKANRRRRRRGQH